MSLSMASLKLFLGFLLAEACSARSWVTLVNPALFATGTLDPYRAEFAIEKDPFTNYVTAPTPVPFNGVYPVDETTSSAEEAESFTEDQVEAKPPTDSPTLAEVADTASPTQRDQIPNGGCQPGASLYRIRMHDKWGDGWGSTTLKVLEFDTTTTTEPTETPEFTESETIVSEEGDNILTMSSTVEIHHVHDKEYEQAMPIWNSREIYDGSLKEGLNGYEYVCLQPSMCYKVIVDGGLWKEEIKWDIHSALDDTAVVAKGWAPAQCQFSISAEEMPSCPSVCQVNGNHVREESTLPAVAEYAGEEESVAPSDAPSLMPIYASSQSPSDAPSLVPSDMPSAAPSRVAWGLDNY